MNTTAPVNTTAFNYSKVQKAKAALNEMMAESLKRGFFGTARLEVAVQDGTIQHIRRSLELIEK